MPARARLFPMLLAAAALAAPGCDGGSDLPPASLADAFDAAAGDADDTGRRPDHRPYGDPGPVDPGAGDPGPGPDGTTPDDVLPDGMRPDGGPGDDLPWTGDPGATDFGPDGPRPDAGKDPGACVPTCGNDACGDDGCGGTCGSCTGGTVCLQGACGLPPDGLTCAQGIECALGCGSDLPCFQGCVNRISGPDSVAWNTLQSCVFQKCPEVLSDVGALEACARNACAPEAAACQGDCVPDCGARECGEDGCGGSCGGCGGAEACIDGTCVTGPATTCPDIVDCALACGQDFNCILACDDAASPADQQAFAALMNCAMTTCLGSSGDPAAFQTCVYASCPAQAAACLGA